MEIKNAIHITGRLMRFSLCVFFLISVAPLKVAAQPPVKMYDVTIQDGQERIELNKKISKAALDSFIIKYNLNDLALNLFIKTNFSDSLKRKGWKIEMNNEQTFVIAKPLFSFDNFNDPADKIVFTEKKTRDQPIFPAINNGIKYGYNRFRNKYPFAIKGSVVTFFLRNNKDADHVVLSGSFIDWSPEALQMIRTDSGWFYNVKLDPGKYWYKFIVDGNWIIDNDNLLRENDGFGNTNSIFYKPNITFMLDGFSNAKKVFLAGSFNNWENDKLQMLKTSGGWKLPIYLAEGTHTYRFITDGEWRTDPKNNDRFPNEFGDFNSVIRIGNPHLFTLNGYTNAKQVMLAGSFNDWHDYELLMNKTATGWELPYTLGPGNYEYRFLVDGKWITDPGNLLTTANKEKNFSSSFLIIEPNYTFRLKGFSNAKTVFLAGDFDNWSPSTLAMKHEGDEWVFNIHLSAGKHLYKFIVDGEWIIDPSNKLWEKNEEGTGNSIMWIDR